MRDRVAGGWLECYQPRPHPGVRLFCFPYAGGGAAVYRSWQRRLPDTVEVCPVQPPGRGGRLREAPLKSLAALAQAAAKGLLPLLDRPFAVFGHSLGALVGFELCRLLRDEHGLTPGLLFVSGRGGPELPLGRPPAHALPHAELIEQLRTRYDAVPTAVLEDAELLNMLLPGLRADLEAYETYAFRPGRPLACPIAAYGGEDDADFSPASLERWRQHTTGSFFMRTFPGRHFYLSREEPALLLELEERLRASRLL